MSQVLVIAEKLGITGITPIELSDGGNLIIHLAPHPFVARIATVMSQETADCAYRMLERELEVARHLHSKGVPALLPADLIDAGPYRVGGTWMTLWQYAFPEPLAPPSPTEAIELVNGLSKAMKDFGDELPVLGVWERICQSAVRLSKHTDQRVQALLNRFQKVDEQIRLDSSLLMPCHGDAHRGNLIPSPHGWIWSDFEDVSRMPAYWDLASFVGNLVLFGGTQEPTFRGIMDYIDNDMESQAFGFTLTARILMSTIGNLDFALVGYGDLEFALKQLDLAEAFILNYEGSSQK
jgi:hypothetical protein